MTEALLYKGFSLSFVKRFNFNHQRDKNANER